MSNNELIRILASIEEYKLRGVADPGLQALRRELKRALAPEPKRVSNGNITPIAAIAWLNELAEWFGQRITNEDSEYWANRYNADNAKKIAQLIERLSDE